jgi:uncharacterized membrane protein
MVRFISWMDYPTMRLAMYIKTKASTKKLSFIGVMTALCISSNYLMIGITNVKFMDLFVFISGYIMGSLAGASVGTLTWFVYGTLNPYGFSLPTLIATCMGESLYGIVGGIFGKFGLSASSTSSTMITEKRFWEANLKIGIVGFLLTFIYDLFTNVVTGIVFEIPLIAWIIAGIPFAIAHETSNFFFFFLGGNLLINAIKKVAGR